MLTKLISVIICVFFLSQCRNNTKEHNFSEAVPYNGYIPLKRSCICKEATLKIKNLDIYLETESGVKSLLNESIIAIQCNGEVFRGKYEYPIHVIDFCFCLDQDVASNSTLAVWLIDTVNNKMQIWENKETYNFLPIEKSIKLKLMVDGGLEIKFDDEWFYHK